MHILSEFKKPLRPVQRVFIHCTASDNPAHDNIETIVTWHRKRGFNGVGYHFLILKSGAVVIGRDIERIPAAQEGNNTGSIAICLTGLHQFSAEQFAALRHLCADIDDEYNGRVTFHGHCEVSNKSCPVFDYRQVLNLSPDGRLNQRSA